VTLFLGSDFGPFFSEFLPSLLEAAAKQPELSVCEQDDFDQSIDDG
jgi:hypothetical protein